MWCVCECECMGLQNNRIKYGIQLKIFTDRTEINKRKHDVCKWTNCIYAYVCIYSSLYLYVFVSVGYAFRGCLKSESWFLPIQTVGLK